MTETPSIYTTESKMKYLVTTDKTQISSDRPIAMVDGTVPGWKPKEGDLHFDHHRPGGEKVQIDEIPEGIEINGNWTICTTQIDADACVAAAWLQLPRGQVDEEAKRKLRAIALDCDYLCIPPGEDDYQDLAEFAAKAVADLKMSGFDLPERMGLPSDRKSWTAEMKQAYTSEAFKQGTEWLIDAAMGHRDWPGESEGADKYFEQVQQDINAMRQLKVVRIIHGVALFDQRSINKYVDPRCLVAIANEMKASEPITLTQRSMPYDFHLENVKNPLMGSQYTLGSLPSHPKAPSIDLTKIFPVLSEAEADRREDLALFPAETTWGGRAAVGGSGWNDPSLLLPEEVIAIALSVISATEKPAV